MDTISKDELKTLVERPNSVCLSLLMPLSPSGPAAQEGPIRLENLLRDAEARLINRGMHEREIQELLSPARRLIEDRPFWQQRGHGLAIFSAPALFRVYRLPVTLPEFVIVNGQAYIIPLLSLLNQDQPFYLLALSLNHIRLLRCSHYSVSEVMLHDVPESLADALKYDEFAKQSQFHSGVSGRGGERGPIFHGQGARSDVIKGEILRYFQQIDRGVHERLRDEQAPLVLAAVEYLLPLYREATSYPYLLDAALIGSLDHLSAETLHARAWSIVEPIFQRAEGEAFERYQLLDGTQPSRVSTYLRRIIPAACAGRVETLFVVPEQQQWGDFDRATSALTLHSEALSGDSELLNFAAIQTFLHNGTVYLVDQAWMPHAASRAAIFRY